ncbi:MAG TPA: biopolymer transporter ExbD [Gemmatimonadaceae bacterium]|nr:biopolymer transporter ExbD [Gemmatimonadaceae bacterium]
MARRRRRHGLELDADINVVNLIDVMMLLMVIFMITAPMMQGGVDIALPKAEARPLQANSGLVVTVDRTGAIFVDDNKLSYDEFRAGFKALATRRGTQGGIYLRADQGVPYGDVVRVLAVMRGAGVGDVGLVAEPENIAR